MKPQRFSIGQQITPSKNDGWIPYANGLPCFGEVYHVSGYSLRHDNGKNFVKLSELRQDLAFDDEKFDPIELTDSEISSLLEETQTQIV